jgi:hypothetical protein
MKRMFEEIKEAFVQNVLTEGILSIRELRSLSI